MLFNPWMGWEEMICHCSPEPHMQHHSYILTDHLKYMYMLLMCPTQSHSYMFPFIKPGGGCIYSMTGVHFEMAAVTFITNGINPDKI